MDRDYGTAQAADKNKTEQKTAKANAKAVSAVGRDQSSKSVKAQSPSKGKTKSAPEPCWKTIELDYRAGIKTLRQIAEEHGITHGAINKRAKRDDWERDLSKKIKAKADALVSKSAVSKPVSKEQRIAERDVVDANANAIVQVRLGQRRDIQRSRAITMGLLAELEQQVGADTVELLQQLGEIMRSPDDKGNDRRNDLYNKIISLPERAKTMKDLGESLRVLVSLERQAFGLDDKDNETVDALTAVLHEISNRNSNGFTPVAHDPEYDEDDS